MNNKTLKAVILIALLVIPAFVFIFLKTYGENQFSLPYYFPEENELGKIKTSDGDTLYYRIPDIDLVDVNDRKLKLSSFDSKLKVLGFYEPTCDSLTSLFLKNIGRVNETFKKDEKIKFLFIDVTNDYENSQEQLKFQEDRIASGMNLNFVKGKGEDFDQMIERVEFVTDSLNETNACETLRVKYNVLLLDNEDKVRGIYSAFDLNEIERLRLEIKVLKDILKIY